MNPALEYTGAAVNVLVVDDDAETLALVSRALERRGYRVMQASDAAAAEGIVAESAVDVIVLDVMLPGDSGLALCARLREAGVQTPILFLSARGAVASRVDGLEAGGDDYLSKPFALKELVARVRALGRRGAALRPRKVRAGTAVFDFAARRAEQSGTEVPLTAREWDVVEALAAREGRPMAYDELLEAAWGETSDAARASLEVIVARLRRKLETTDGARIIRTLRGYGYALDLTVA